MSELGNTEDTGDILPVPAGTYDIGPTTSGALIEGE